MAYKIKFGTDGWRGVIAEDYTFDNVRRCTQGFATYLIEHGRQGQWVIVGHHMDAKSFGSCVYYPCEKNRRLGVSACIGCAKYVKRNPEPASEDDGG